MRPGIRRMPGSQLKLTGRGMMAYADRAQGANGSRPAVAFPRAAERLRVADGAAANAATLHPFESCSGAAHDGAAVVEAGDLVVKTLGSCRVDSPLIPLLNGRRPSFHNVEETDRVLFDDTSSAVLARGVPLDQLPGFEPAGARRRLFFDPSKTRAGIVTCGGLCPGLNDVIRALVMELYFHY